MTQYITAGDLQCLFPNGTCADVWTKTHIGPIVVSTPIRRWKRKGDIITLTVDNRKGKSNLRDVRPAYTLTLGL